MSGNFPFGNCDFLELNDFIEQIASKNNSPYFAPSARSITLKYARHAQISRNEFSLIPVREIPLVQN